MRLQKLTGLERDKLRAEYDELMAVIADLKDILDRVERRMEIIKPNCWTSRSASRRAPLHH